MAAAIIETPRLTLRGWSDDDVEPWCSMNADTRVTEFFPIPFPRERSLALAAALREELEQRGYGWWVLERKAQPGFAGVIALADITFQAHFTPAVEIGWRLPHEFWGNGYAAEGARAVLELGFNRLRLEEIVSLTAVPNVRSQRVMQKIGMTHDPRDDFDHPKIEPGHWLSRHVLYRIKRDAYCDAS